MLVLFFPSQGYACFVQTSRIRTFLLWAPLWVPTTAPWPIFSPMKTVHSTGSEIRGLWPLILHGPYYNQDRCVQSPWTISSVEIGAAVLFSHLIHMNVQLSDVPSVRYIWHLMSSTQCSLWVGDWSTLHHSSGPPSSYSIQTCMSTWLLLQTHV